MRRSTIAILAAPVAIAVLGLAARLDGLAAIGVSFGMAAAMILRFMRKDPSTRHATSLALAVVFAVEAVVDLRNPGAPFSQLFGFDTWKLMVVVAIAALVDATGATERLEERAKAMEQRGRRTGS